MAIKDWKQNYQTTYSTSYQHKIGKKWIIIEKGKVGYFVIKESMDDKETSHFKTKSQALKFARNYMRTH